MEITVTYAGVPGAKGDTGANGSIAWQDDWASDHGTYYANDFVYHAVSGYGKGLFRCILEHDPSVAATEPVTGGSASTYWETSIGGGQNSDFLADGTTPMTGALTMTQIATPDEPAASKTSIYAKADGKVYRYSNGGEETEIGSGAGFWSDVPGTPTRVSDTQFTVTGDYSKAFAKGTILQWLETATFNTAMVESASYSAPDTTINIVGDSLTAGFTDMKYCIHKAIRLRLPIVPGTLAVADNPSGVYEYMPWDAIKLSVDAFVGTAGTTNATTGHVNDDGTAINSTDFSIASTETSDLGNVCDAPTTIIAAASKLSIDITGVSTTAPVDLYVYLWCYPESWRYMA